MSALLLTGCLKTMSVRPSSQLAKESVTRRQMSGRFLARGVGLKRLLGAVEIDAIVQAPSSVYVSVRSFFSQPARTFVADGDSPILELEDILPIEISPHELVDVILGRVSADSNEEVKLRHDGVVLGRTLTDKKGKLIYSVDYEDFRKIDEIDVAHKWNFKARLNGDEHRFVLTADDVIFNGKPFGPETFRHD